MEWVVKVTAIDVRGNVTRDSMVVATANGNPADLAGPECRARSLSLSPPSPNPSGAGGARLTLHLPRDENVRAVVYDATGSRVQTLAEGPCGAGRHTLDWEGRDARGNPAAPGVYFLRVDAGKLGATSTRIVKRH